MQGMPEMSMMKRNSSNIGILEAVRHNGRVEDWL